MLMAKRSVLPLPRPAEVRSRITMHGSKNVGDRMYASDASVARRLGTGELPHGDVRLPGRLARSDDLALPPELVEQLGRALARALVKSIRRDPDST